MFDSDKVLIKGCKKGKKRAQEALYAKYSKSMYVVALRYAKVTHEAEDAHFMSNRILTLKEGKLS